MSVIKNVDFFKQSKMTLNEVYLFLEGLVQCDVVRVSKIRILSVPQRQFPPVGNPFALYPIECPCEPFERFISIAHILGEILLVSPNLFFHLSF